MALMTRAQRKEGDKSRCWADVEGCSTASKDEAPRFCDKPHKVLEGLGHVDESVQILINKFIATSEKLGTLDEVLTGDLSLRGANAVLAPLLDQREKASCDWLA